jgi:drug/metabolite transporter (DMT)-like permease
MLPQMDLVAQARFSPVTCATFWMGGALLSFLAMALGGRELSGGLSTFQILFFRSLVGLVVIGLLVLLRTGWQPLRTRRLGAHISRNIFHFGGQFGWFFAIAAIPLAEVFAIEFTIPIWTALLAALFLGERLSRARLLALALGIAGVLFILRPGASMVQPAALAALLGAMAYAAAHIQTKRLTSTEAPMSVLFYMTVVQLPLGLLGAAFDWRPVQDVHVPWLLVVGLSALSAHYCLTRALKLADVGVVLPMDFLRLPMVAVLGFWLYGETVGLMFVLGTALILVGNVLNLRSARGPERVVPPTRAEAQP